MRSSDWSSDVCSSDLVGICEGSVERKRQSGCRNDSCLQLNAPNSFIGRVDAYGLAGRIIGYALGNAGRHSVEELQRALVFAVERGDIQPSADASGLPIPFGERKRGGEGRGVPVSVELGGGRRIKKKTKISTKRKERS